MMNNLTYLIKSAVLGHAVGDALGVPVEFLLRKEMDRKPIKTMEGFGTYPYPAGTWSDDTSMALCTLDSLIKGKIDYPCRMTRYDAFQMFKHALACYSACLGEELRKIKKLTLVNCIWTLPVPKRLSSEHHDRYIKEEDCEHAEFKEFKELMKPVKSLFAESGIDFDIEFYTFKDFLSLFDKNKSELNYLKRYTFA